MAFSEADSMGLNGRGNTVIAPDGSRATYDRMRTTALYETIDAEADCSCIWCKNYRAAWAVEYLDPSLLAACFEIGIDPSKALEATHLAADIANGLHEYYPQYPFFGEVDDDVVKQQGTWWFNARAYGSAQVDPGIAGIGFLIQVPWVLSEASPET